jgi:hypothetical protein
VIILQVEEQKRFSIYHFSFVIFHCLHEQNQAVGEAMANEELEMRNGKSPLLGRLI